MVKAVNKLVLEINNTENQYFEKAILYVRPERSASTNAQLQAGARDYLAKIGTNKPIKRHIPMGITVAGAVGAGATVMGVIMAVFRPF